MDRLKKMWCAAARWANRYPLLLSLVSVGAVMGLSTLFVQPYFQTNDDYAIAILLSGDGRVAPTPYVPFINFAFAQLAVFLYRLPLFQSVNVLGVCEYLVLFFAAAAIVYCLLCVNQKPGRFVAAAIFMVVSVPLCSAVPSYTSIAGYGSFAGLFLMYLTVKRRRKKWQYIFPVLLAISGYVLRPKCFLIVLPFVALIVAWDIFPAKGFSGFFKKTAPYLIGFAVLFAGVAAFEGYHAYRYAHWDSEYQAFNRARATVQDYPLAPYSELEDELGKIGVSENDYAMINSWATADPDFFTAETFREIAALQPETPLTDVWHTFSTSSILSLPQNTWVQLGFIACLVSFAASPTVWVGLFSLFNIAFLLAVRFYFEYLGRNTGAVTNVYCFAFLAASLFLAVEAIPAAVLRKGARYKFCAMLLAAAFVIVNPGYIQMVFANRSERALAGNLYSALLEREDNRYVMVLGSTPGLYRDFSPVSRAPGRNSLDNYISPGGWLVNHPATVQFMGELGLRAPLLDLEKDGVYLVSSGDAAMFSTYLQEHAGSTGAYSLVEVVEGHYIYKFSPNRCQVPELENVSITGVYRIYRAEVPGMSGYSLGFGGVSPAKEFYRGLADFPAGQGMYVEFTSDSTGEKKTFMVYPSSVSFTPKGNGVFAYIPFDQLQPGAYRVRLMIENQGVCTYFHGSVPFAVTY